MLRITARHADEWNTWGDRRGGRSRAERRSPPACERVGRDAATMHTSVQALVVRSATAPPTAPHRADGRPRGSPAAPSSIVDQIGRYAELGFDEFILPMFHILGGPAGRRDSLEQFAPSWSPPTTAEAVRTRHGWNLS